MQNTFHHNSSTRLDPFPGHRKHTNALALCLTPCMAAIQLLLAAPAMAQSGFIDLVAPYYP